MGLTKFMIHVLYIYKFETLFYIFSYVEEKILDHDGQIIMLAFASKASRMCICT